MPWTVPADTGAVKYLEESLRSGRASHAFLLGGPPGVGVGALAREFAQALLCEGTQPPCGQCRQCKRAKAGTHPDIMGIQPSGPGAMIGVDAVRELKSFASLQPYQARGRVLLVDGAEAMTRDAENALLKLLEEPPPGVTLVLTTADAEALLPTIFSRCQSVRLRPLPFERVEDELRAQGVDAEQAKQLARLAGGRLEAALAFAQNGEALDVRRKALDELLELGRLGPAGRLKRAGQIAEGFTRERDAPLYVRLELWASLWRDAFVVLAGAPEGVIDAAIVPQLGSLADSVAEASRVVQEIYATLDILKRNANPRLAVEVLVLRLPQIK